MSTLFDWVELPASLETVLPVVTRQQDILDGVVTKNTGGTQSMLPLVTTCYHKKHNTYSKSVCVCEITHTHDDSNRLSSGSGNSGNSGNILADYTCEPSKKSGNGSGNSGNRVVTGIITVTEKHPLYMPATGDYRRWLWDRMQADDSAALWDQLMEIANLVWTEQPFKIDYAHADVILAAVKKYVIGDLKHKQQEVETI